MVELSLIRHGETEYNSVLRIQGSLDSPLTERGRSQALQLGRHLAGQKNYQNLNTWFCSPQGRAVETSDLMRRGWNGQPLPDVSYDDRLREIHCGDLEGKLIPDVDAQVLERLRNEPTFAYPNGESIEDVILRASSFWRDLQPQLQSAARSDGTDHRVVIVSHGNFLRCLTSVILSLPSLYAVRVVLENTGLCYFRSLHDGAVLKMLRWNDRSHLDVR